MDGLVAQFNTNWGEIRYSTLDERARLTAQRDLAREHVEQQIKTIQESLGPRPSSCGFSLDPYPENAPKYAYQKANYICDLQGTETGMLLFYTDLLAKLWAIDFQREFPRNIPEFVPMTETKVSPLYLGELQQLPHTRIWFGLLRKGFQSTPSTLLFSHTVTRVFALSRIPGERSKEVPPNAVSSAFMNWWNSHYDEIASWEPRYQKLNQIVKWSLLLGWLESNKASDKLLFLDNEQLTRSRWFPDWVRQQNDLRFRKWDQIGFYPRGNTSETMAILTSEPYELFGRTWVLSGGVSLGAATNFNENRPSPDSFSDIDRRGGINFGNDGYPNSIVTADGVNYQFSGDQRRALVTAHTPGNPSLRGSSVDFASTSVEFAFSQSAEGLEVRTRVEGFDEFSLRFAERPNGFGIERARGSLLRASSLLSTLSENRESDLMNVIVNQPAVIAAIRLPNKSTFLVGFRGEDRWLKVDPDMNGGSSLGVGEVRVADSDPGANPYRGIWISSEDASKQIRRFQGLSFERVRGSSEGIRVEVDAPMAELSMGSVAGSELSSRSERDGMVSLHRARSELPPDALYDPKTVAELLPSSGLEHFLQYVVEGDVESASGYLARDSLLPKQIADYRIKRLFEAGRALESQDYSKVIQKLAPLAEMNPSDPEVAVPLGIANMLNGKSQNALAAFATIFGSSLPRPNEFLNSLREEVKRLPVTDQEKLGDLENYLRFSDQAGRRPDLKLSGYPYTDGGRLRFVAQLEEVVRTQAVSPSIALSEIAPKYLFDAVPAGAEWIPSPSALDQLVPQNISSAARHEHQVLASTMPSGIHIARTGEHFSRIEPATAGDASHIYYLHPPPPERK